MTRKVIETHISRKFTVERFEDAVFLYVENTAASSGDTSRINSRMTKGTAEDLGLALLENAGKRAHLFEGRLPIVNLSSYYLDAGTDKGYIRRDVTNTSDEIAEQIKSLISIHKYLLTREEDEKKIAEEAKAALEAKLKEQEAALEKRRNTLAGTFDKNVFTRYKDLDEATRNAVDYIIEKEADK